MFGSTFDPTVRELDLVTLSVQVFAPLLVAIVVRLLPRRWPELARWVALSGASAVLALGLCRLVDYHTLLDSYSDRTVQSLYHPAARMDSRADQQAADAFQPVPRPFRSDDLYVRRPWIARLDVDYALGLDGINLAVVLAAAATACAGIIASWRVPTDPPHGMLAAILFLQTTVTGAVLAVDLALILAFGTLTVLGVGLMLRAVSAAALRPLIVPATVGLISSVGVVAWLHTADVRDFVDPGIVAERAAELRQVNPQLSRDNSLAQASIHTFHPVALSRFLLAATLMHRGQSERLTERETPFDTPKFGETQSAVPVFAPGVERAAALARLHADPVASPHSQRALFALLTLAAVCALGLVPANGWLTATLRRLPTPTAIIVAGGVWPAAAALALRFVVPLGVGGAREFATWLAVWGVLSCVVACFQSGWATNLRQLAAAQLTFTGGLILIGLGSWGSNAGSWEQGIAGAAFLAAAGGLSAAGLLTASGMIRSRFGHDDVEILGQIPIRLAIGTVLALLAGGAIPGLGVAIGSAGVILAALATCKWIGLATVSVVVIFAVQRVVLAARFAFARGVETRSGEDADAGESFLLGAFAVLAIVLGIVPSLVFLWLYPAIQGWVEALAPVK